MNMQLTKNVVMMITEAHRLCVKEYRHQFITPEHMLNAIAEQKEFKKTLNEMGINENDFSEPLIQYLSTQEVVPGNEEYNPDPSRDFQEVLGRCAIAIMSAGGHIMTVPHIVNTICNIFTDESPAKQIIDGFFHDNFNEFISALAENYSESEHTLNKGWGMNIDSTMNGTTLKIIGMDEVGTDGKKTPLLEKTTDDPMKGLDRHKRGSEPWRELVTCLNDTYQKHNPLVGREQELERTIQVLCRKDKNNPLHVGDPGVGKTSLIYGLTQMIEEGRVPERLIGSTVYMMDITTMVAGCQYRGEFEKRMKIVLDGIKAESSNNILYIDEIHMIMGAGSGSDAMDGAGILKPYLEDGSLRFIGSTTYEEYNRHIMKSPGFVRRFQMIDIPEPTVDEAKIILEQLRPSYEQFHHVKYGAGVINYAVESSAKHILERRLPDKAIDLLDEAGAILEIQAGENKRRARRTVTKKMIDEVLQKTCKVKAEVLTDDTNQSLKSLYERISNKVFGQDEAVRSVVESVQMSKAGLLDDNKPLASLLFVGPTGVGKTEVAKVLAQELGVELIRFDMSEYTEKHAVAKLIGSPAGYVGYDDGGQLTDVIRKNPNCVLLLDEIEKANQEIYDILLQVMDYARLTDNKGRKADFRNVVLIMTSNAGAQYASQASIGFTGNVSRGEAMLKQVKKTFKPEFINRLSGTVVFHDMDKQMATRILNKKLGELQSKLEKKQVTMTLTDAAFENILSEGFVPEYGAREMDRVIAQRLKPLLMREILFGKLSKGGDVEVDFVKDELKICMKR